MTGPGKMLRGGAVATILALALLLALPETAEACATCFGDPESPMTQGLNKGILTLLAFIGMVQVGIVGVVWNFRKRAKRFEEESGSRG